MHRDDLASDIRGGVIKGYVLLFSAAAVVCLAARNPTPIVAMALLGAGVKGFLRALFGPRR